MMTYAEFAALPASEKIILATIQARTQFKVWQFSFMPYTFHKIVPHFVTDVRVDGVSMVKMDSPSDFFGSTPTGQFCYEPKLSKLSIRMPLDVLPRTKNVVVTYKFFFSNTPVILPYNLTQGGEAVEWEARIPENGIGNLGQQLDDESTGIVLESSSQIQLNNGDRFFDSLFDTLIWENQDIEFFSWSPLIPLSQKIRLFKGLVENKGYDSDKIVFKVKDFVFKLKNQVKLGIFTEADGQIADSILGKPKRRIYGRVKNIKAVGIDSVLDGYQLTGTITIAPDTNIITGTGTEFLKELSTGDELTFILDDGSIEKLNIDEITSDTAATASDETEFSILNKSAKCSPSIPYRFKNRRWHLAGHKLREPSSQVVYPTTSKRYSVNNVEDFFPDDVLTINGLSAEVKRISGNNIILKQSVFPVPTSGDIFVKSPVTRVFFGSKELFIDRDFTLTNTTEAIIELDPEAEFNIARQKTVGVNLTFTSGSRSITTATNLDLRTIIKPRDWIRCGNISTPEWYEVLDVRQQTVTIRNPFTGSTQTTGGRIKVVDLIDDDSLITVDCVGYESVDGAWVKTASDAVKHLIQFDAGFTDIDEESFSQAKLDCNYIMSIVIPESIGAESPQVRDVITKINESVFGSLYGNKSMNLSYAVLTARKPEDMMILREDDILSWEADTEQKIVNKVKVNYRPFIDVFTGEPAFKTIEFGSSFVDEMIGIEDTDEVTLYLYEDDKANIMAHRRAFYRSLSNCKITLKGKLNLSLVAVNDRIVLELDRMFNRFAGQDAKKISIVTGTKKNGTGVELILTDLGNIFNRVPSIAPNTTGTYADSSREDTLRYAFIVDNDVLTPDPSSETDLGSNRIG